MEDAPTHISEIIRSRRTVHDFDTERDVDLAVIMQAIEDCRFAPNHHLTEPWHFYLPGEYTTNQIIELNSELLLAKGETESAEKKRNRWQSMPGWMVITTTLSKDKIRYKEDYAASCCAIQNLMLLLWAHGIGMKWCSSPVIQEAKCYDILWINKKEQEILGIFWYGYPSAIPDTNRSPLTKCVTSLD